RHVRSVSFVGGVFEEVMCSLVHNGDHELQVFTMQLAQCKPNKGCMQSGLIERLLWKHGKDGFLLKAVQPDLLREVWLWKYWRRFGQFASGAVCDKQGKWPFYVFLGPDSHLDPMMSSVCSGYVSNRPNVSHGVECIVSQLQVVLTCRWRTLRMSCLLWL
ncbi:hypothetical protein IRJ41_021330, partial [Triplophysa rosa]